MILRCAWLCIPLVLWLAGIAQSAEPAQLRKWIASLKKHDPATVATENFQKGTIFVFGANGAGGLFYPGIDIEVGEAFAKKYTVRFVPESSAVIKNDLHKEYLFLALAYAEKYNQTTLKLLAVPAKPAQSGP